MSSVEFMIWWMVVLVGIGGSALCSGLEVGLYTVNRVLVRVHAAGGNRGIRARLLESEIEHSTPLLTALLIWNNIFNYAGTLAITTLIATIGLSDVEMIGIQIVALTPVLLIFAESTPKEVFRTNADTLMERFAYVIRFMRLSMTWIPVVPVLLLIANTLAKFVSADSMGSFTSARERMGELLKFGSEHMSEAQVSLIDRALELEHATVRSEMVPIRSAVVLRLSWTPERARGYVRNHPFTRYPVLSSKGQIVGVLDSIDLYIHPHLDSMSNLEALIKVPSRIDGSISVNQALKELSLESGKLGIVTMGGRDVGIITRKDLVEPLIGELEDW